jgi:uncharacterized protein with PQ loop repeat
MESVIDGIGLTSSILISIMFVPQVVHVYRTKDTHAINYAPSSEPQHVGEFPGV